MHFGDIRSSHQGQQCSMEFSHNDEDDDDDDDDDDGDDDDDDECLCKDVKSVGRREEQKVQRRG